MSLSQTLESNHWQLFVPGYIEEYNGYKRKTNKHQKVTTPVLNGDSIPCLIDSGSSLSVISLQLAQKFQLDIFNVRKGLSVAQMQGILTLMEKCYISLKIGHTSKNIDFFCN